MGYGYWKKYVPVAKRRAKAQSHAQKLDKEGKPLEPVIVNSRSIASTFWGKAWCNNLEAYSDYANRLPRARTYVRNGSVIDLKILPGKVMAQVVGSSRYRIEIDIQPMATPRWHELVKDCTGSIESLVELLQGQLSDAVMQRICAPKTGLFPSPAEIRFSCSCPDWADMCKHVGAALYGVGARLDADPQLLFTLRKVDANDLLSAQTADIAAPKNTPTPSRMLSEDALSDLFDIDMAALDTPSQEAVDPPPDQPKQAKSKANKPTATKKESAKKSVSNDAAQKKVAQKKAAAKKVVTKKPTAKKSTVTESKTLVEAAKKVPKTTPKKTVKKTASKETNRTSRTKSAKTPGVKGNTA